MKEHLILFITVHLRICSGQSEAFPRWLRVSVVSVVRPVQLALLPKLVEDMDKN
jgi:hypothetical protein